MKTKKNRLPFFLGPPPLRGSFFLENGTLRETREKKIFPIGSKIVRSKSVTDVPPFYSSESNTKLNLFGSKELAS